MLAISEYTSNDPNFTLPWAGLQRWHREVWISSMSPPPPHHSDVATADALTKVHAFAKGLANKDRHLAGPLQAPLDLIDYLGWTWDSWCTIEDEYGDSMDLRMCSTSLLHRHAASRYNRLIQDKFI